MKFQQILAKGFFFFLVNPLLFAQTSHFLEHFAPTSTNGGAGLTGIAVSQSGEIYVSGIFSDVMDADPAPGPMMFPLSSNGDFDGFLLKLNQQGQLIWATSFGGPGEDKAYDLSLDDAGNVYCTGSMRDSMDMDPGTGIQMAYSAGFQDIFLISYSSGGQFRWGHTFGGAGEDEGAAIASDGFGTSVITGHFADTVDFDPLSVHEIIALGSQDIFVAEYDSVGRLLWAAQMGGNYEDKGSGIEMDRWGNVLTTGYFQDTADFDPSPSSVYNLMSLPNNFDLEIFICKFTRLGGFIWAKSIGGPDPDGGDYGTAISCDAMGNSYSTGQFDAIADFDPDPVGDHNLSAIQYQDGYILKLDSAGNFVYALPLNGTGAERCHSLVASNAGEVYATGYFDAAIDLDPGAGTYNLTCTTIENAFILHLDHVGNFVQGDQITGDFSDGSCVALDTNGYPYFGGFFLGTAIFDTLFVTDSLVSIGYFDGYLFGGVFGSTGIDQADKQQSILIFPNPSHDKIQLDFVPEFPGSGAWLEIYDMNGRKVKRQQVNSCDVVHLEELNPGIYELRLHEGESVKRTRLVIQ